VYSLFFEGYNFRWEHDSPVFPGWQLTQPWLTDEGMVNRGILNVRYYSGERTVASKYHEGVGDSDHNVIIF
jgi:hypothetical protein